MVLPIALIFFQMSINGHYRLAPDFVHQDTSFLDNLGPEDGVDRKVVLIPVKNDPHDSVLHAWLYMPENVASSNTKIPIVIMSHGIGGQKDMGLARYGKAFVKAGYGALMFDYRHFGGSYSLKKAPFRNYINPWMHYSDIQTVLQFVQEGNLAKEGVDNEKIILWGSSFGGGHVLAATATLPERHPSNSSMSGTHGIRAVISQIPHLNGKLATKQAILTRGVLGTLRVLAVAGTDFVTSLVGPFMVDLLCPFVKMEYSPMYVPIAGPIGSTSYMTMTEEGLKKYTSKHPKVYLGGWRNLAPARTMAVISLYNPENYLDTFPASVPLLFVTAGRDALCPPSLVEEALQRHKGKLSTSEIATVDCDHFDIYEGEPFAHAVSAMRNFLKKHL